MDDDSIEEFVESLPLVSENMTPNQKELSYGKFNLKEQMRLDTGEWHGKNIIGMSFAQRKFIGFRCKFEYDAKAVLLYSENQILVLTYTLESMGESSIPHDDPKRESSSQIDCQKQAQISLKWQPGENEKIV